MDSGSRSDVDDGKFRKRIAQAFEQARRRLLDLSYRNRLVHFAPGSSQAKSASRNIDHLRVIADIPSLWRRLVDEENDVQVVTYDKAEQEELRRQGTVGSDDDAGVSGSDGSAVRKAVVPGQEKQLTLFMGGRRSGPGSGRRQVRGSEDLTDIFVDELKSGNAIADQPHELAARRLDRIWRKQNLLMESTGDSALFLALGFVEWSDAIPGGPPRQNASPLLLVHVELERAIPSSGGEYAYVLRMDGTEVQDNPALRAKLEREHSIHLPAFDPERYTSWATYAADVTKALRRMPDWKVNPVPVLGFFNFAKYSMYIDLDATRWPSENKPEDHPIATALIDRRPLYADEGNDIFPNDAAVASRQVDNDLPLVLGADSTQYKALMAASDGRSLVIVGPPGTGKSQTITNLIAGLISEGKTVLFAAQKTAALEVVHENLRQVGLEHACLPIYSHQSTPKEVGQRLKASDQWRTSRNDRRPPIDQSPTFAKRLNALRAALIQPAPDHDSAVTLIHRANALRCRAEKDWGTAWDDNILNLEIPAHNIAPEWWAKREECLRRWRALLDQMSPIWNGWNPSRVDADQVPQIAALLRVLHQTITAVISGVQPIAPELADEPLEVLREAIRTALLAVPPAQPLPTLLLALAERPALAGDLSGLLAPLLARRGHLTRAELVLACAHQDLPALLRLGRDSVACLLGVVGPSTLFSSVAVACDTLGELDHAFAELRHLSGLQPDGITALGGLTWSEIALVGKLRERAMYDLPRGFMVPLAHHLCGSLERMRKVEDFVQQVEELQKLERLAATLPCSSTVLPPETARRLEDACVRLVGLGLDRWTLQTLTALSGELDQIATHASALAASDENLLVAWGSPTVTAILKGTKDILPAALIGLPTCDLRLVMGITEKRFTIAELQRIPAARVRLAEVERDVAASCNRCTPPLYPHAPVVLQLQKAWQSIPAKISQQSEDFPSGSWLTIADDMSRAHAAWVAVCERAAGVAAALNLGSPVTIGEVSALIHFAHVLGLAPVIIPATQAESVAELSNLEELQKITIRLDAVQANRARLARLLPINDLGIPDELSRQRRIWVGRQGEWFAFLNSEYRQARNYLRRLLGRNPDKQGVRTIQEAEDLLRAEHQLVQPPILPEVLTGLWAGAATSSDRVKKLLAWIEHVRAEVSAHFKFTLGHALRSVSHPAIAAALTIQVDEVASQLCRALSGWAEVSPLPTQRLDLLSVAATAATDRAQTLARGLREAQLGIDVPVRRWIAGLARFSDADHVIAELARISGPTDEITWIDYPLERLLSSMTWIDAWHSSGGSLLVASRLFTSDGQVAAQQLITTAENLRRSLESVSLNHQGSDFSFPINIDRSVHDIPGALRDGVNAINDLTHFAAPLPGSAAFTIETLRLVLVTGRQLSAIQMNLAPWAEVCRCTITGNEHAAIAATLEWIRKVRNSQVPLPVVAWICDDPVLAEERAAWWQTFHGSVRKAWELWRRAGDLGVLSNAETAPSAAIILWHDQLKNRLGQWRSAYHNLATRLTEGSDHHLRAVSTALDELERALAIELELSVWDGTLGIPTISVEPETVRAHQSYASTLVGARPPLRKWLLHSEIRARHKELRATAHAIDAVWSSSTKAREVMDELGTMSKHGPAGIFNLDMPIHQLLGLASKLIDGLDHLLPTAQYRREESRAYALGMTELIVRMREARIDADACIRTFQAAVRHKQAAATISSIPELRTFASSSYSDQVRSFREHEKTLLASNQTRIQNNVRQRVVTSGKTGGKVTSLTESFLLKKEWDKQKKRIPIRALVGRAGTAMRDLCPCWLMTPIAIAQFLPNELEPFDVIVMDEASQLDPEDALGAILRGRQAVIVGDPKQMPPSNFFQASDEDDEDDTSDEAEDSGIKAESVLDMALSSLPQSCLQWHYRSRHQSLIAPANAFSYGNELVLFPSPFRESTEFGIIHRPITDGTFISQRNMPEAEAVVERLVNLLRESAAYDDPDQAPSIGVVSMNLHQQEAIHDLLQARCQKDRALGHLLHLQLEKRKHERLTIKNLENFQGDQRDLMIISLTYGPEKPGGTPKQRFTAIGGVDGHRRFNVLITRSKRRMEVFTSLKSEHVTPSANPDALGRLHLQWFLRYCETRQLPESGTRTGREADSPFEIEVAQVLRNGGFTVEHQVGVAGYFVDLGIVNPKDSSRFSLGIECDGWTYHSSACARDRDVQRQRILEERGWTIHRIWSTDWFRNKGQTVTLLIAAAARACGHKQ